MEQSEWRESINTHVASTLEGGSCKGSAWTSWKTTLPASHPNAGKAGLKTREENLPGQQRVCMAIHPSLQQVWEGSKGCHNAIDGRVNSLRAGRTGRNREDQLDWLNGFRPLPLFSIVPLVLLKTIGKPGKWEWGDFRTSPSRLTPPVFLCKNQLKHRRLVCKKRSRKTDAKSLQKWNGDTLPSPHPTMQGTGGATETFKAHAAKGASGSKCGLLAKPDVQGQETALSCKRTTKIAGLEPGRSGKKGASH